MSNEKTQTQEPQTETAQTGTAQTETKQIRLPSALPPEHVVVICTFTGEPSEPRRFLCGLRAQQYKAKKRLGVPELVEKTFGVTLTPVHCAYIKEPHMETVADRKRFYTRALGIVVVYAHGEADSERFARMCEFLIETLLQRKMFKTVRVLAGYELYWGERTK
jgi:hypothetical protein